MQTFWRRLENVLMMSWSFVIKTSLTVVVCLEDVLKTLWTRLEDIFARRLEKFFARPPLQDKCLRGSSFNNTFFIVKEAGKKNVINVGMTRSILLDLYPVSLNYFYQIISETAVHRCSDNRVNRVHKNPAAEDFF